jgi:hypothetical protein
MQPSVIRPLSFAVRFPHQAMEDADINSRNLTPASSSITNE